MSIASNPAAHTTNTFHRPTTTQQAVCAEIRRAILEGQLPPGSVVRQEPLAERFGVSRVPVREALKILEGEGQIYSIPHRGYFVAQLSIEELQEIQHIRGLLETDAIRHAVPRLTENDLQNMSTAFDEMAHASAVVDVGAMNAAHTRFHFSILGASGMPKLTRILQQLSEAADPYRAAYHGDETARATAQAEHQRILHAVRAHDIEHIVDLLDEHRRHTLERLGPTLSGTHPPET